MARRTIVMDVDTGTDDALALLYAIAHPDLQVAAISCVAGNAEVDQVVDNTLKVLDAAGADDIPVAAGAHAPLIERQRREGRFHGVDGLGGVSLPATQRTASALTATELLHRTIIGSVEPVTVVALAPQTNVALLLAQHPDVTGKIERVVFMGGSAGGGNVTAVAEFNVWQDPEAATAVLEADLPTTMYGLDVFSRLLIAEDSATRLATALSPARALAGALLRRHVLRSDGQASEYRGVLGDAGALIYLTNPDLFHVERHPVRVNLSGMGRGQTIVDRRPIRQEARVNADDPWPLVDVVLDGDLTEAAHTFMATMCAYAAS